MCGQSPWVQAEAFAAGRGCGRQQRDLRGSGAVRPGSGRARAGGGAEGKPGAVPGTGAERGPGWAESGRGGAAAGSETAGVAAAAGCWGEILGGSLGPRARCCTGKFLRADLSRTAGTEGFGEGGCCQKQKHPTRLQVWGDLPAYSRVGWGTKSAPVFGGSEEGPGLLEGPGAVPIAVVSGTSPAFPLQWPPPAESRSTGRCR